MHTSAFFISSPERSGKAQKVGVTPSVRFLLATGVSFVLLLIGALGKHLIVSEFRWSNFYLGTDFALAGFTAGLLNLVDMLEAKDVTEVAWKIVWTVSFIAITFGIYMIVLCIHQNIEKRQAIADENHWTTRALGAATVKKRPVVGKFMGMIANFIGLGPSFLFTYWKLKGTL